MPEAPSVWDRQEGETPKAFAAFVVFRDQGPSRSLDAAYREARGQRSGNKRAPGTWTDWYTRYRWKQRAEAYDAHLERLARRDRETEHLGDLQAYRERQKRIAQATIENCVGLMEKAGARLEGLEPEQIPPKLLPAFFRAAAALAEVASNAEAQMIGLQELFNQLGDHGQDSKNGA